MASGGKGPAGEDRSDAVMFALEVLFVLPIAAALAWAMLEAL